MGQDGTRRYRRGMDPGAEQFARLARFASLVAGSSGDIPLDRTALAMAAVLRARPVDGALDELDRLAADCPATTFDELRRHLFEDLGFGGDAERYDDPRNSFLDVVLQRRRGLPILLATVMMEVGRRVGIGVVGVGMPLHFLVRDAARRRRLRRSVRRCATRPPRRPGPLRDDLRRAPAVGGPPPRADRPTVDRRAHADQPAHQLRTPRRRRPLWRSWPGCGRASPSCRPRPAKRCG